MRRRDEFALIRWLTEESRTASPGVSVGIGDDAAVVSFDPAKEVVACCDTMVETVHFHRRTMPPYAIGFKALAANISDVAAMGGIPRFVLIGLAVAEDWRDEELKEIYAGIYDLASRFGMEVIGGDTVKAPDKLSLALTVLGEVEKGRALRRSAAKAGDAVFLTGFPGEAAAGLDWLLRCGKEAPVPPEWRRLVAAHQQPQPMVAAGRLFVHSGIHALNDVSDGLASEAWEIAEASGVRLVLHERAIPVSPALSRYASSVQGDVWEWILYGGEDYILIGTAAKERLPLLEEACRCENVPFFAIGEVQAGKPGVFLQKEDGSALPLPKRGYNHFA
ncbi:thiamine-phosphate kinase [Bacillaceae bacterium]